ncbi:peptide/nickel transport system ATP-binding protein/oligopeptide transport system ATP-binding protein [Kribbella amoyensis]|uniref:Peptide/nickel transport system ATP-binding protein/oligopeptide transport system ATP-binding protein n=1 Tax=Kribbella amoyensis TaxID=996641 RepID=A0A561BSW9_9ACTN|nr:dipeptide/oligopeptide/nickel ABC transporter ATP-binding protein [Kribbella amoyensis]TWD81961.1 peptide/nickel transport system ATP-binding protein/oligopeptide transport system ATP-binding protein [Kribbella amoyensis]
MTGLRISDLTVTYPGPRTGSLGRRSQVEAVRGVSLDVASDEAVALVGESGSGKSTIARAVVGLVAPASGSVEFDGASLLDPRGGPRARRGIAMIFQDPRSSLNPRRSVEASISEAWQAQPDAAPAGVRTDPRRRRDAVVELLDQVGLDPDVARKRPPALSGGQCQRVSIARALALKPRLLICDEAVSALDVSVQAQVLQLLVSIRRTHGLSMLFITHDLGVVRQVADRVAVMRRGELVESAGVQTLFTDPQHDYTRELLSAAVDLEVSA